MKKFLQKTLALLTLCLVSLSAMAESVTFDLSNYYDRNKNGITVICPNYDSNGAEIYGSGDYNYFVALEADGVVIKAVDFTGISKYGGYGTVSIKASTGEFTTSTIENYSKISWISTTSTSYVKFTSAQEGVNDDFYIKTLTVTYEEEAPSTTFAFISSSIENNSVYTSSITGGLTLNHKETLSFAAGKSVSDITVNGNPLAGDTYVLFNSGGTWINYTFSEDGTNTIEIPEGVFVNGSGKTNEALTINFTINLPGITMTEAEWTTFCLNKAWYMPANYTGYVVSDIIDGCAILSDAFTAGSVVPSNCPVLINGPEVSKLIINTGYSYDGVPSNYLYSAVFFGNNETTFTASQMWLYMNILGGDPCDAYLYKLSYDSDGQNLGFYWDSVDGQTLTCKPDKAFLVVPTSKAPASNGLKIRIADHTSGISTIVNENGNVIYNLQGQRVNATKPGVYVKNGKKFIVK